MTSNIDNKERKVSGAVMVVGGGIAGIQSALDLAEQGFYVYLVESEPSIGGRMSMLDKTFPTNDCSTCMLSPKLVEIARHNNIEILTQARLTGLSGEAGHFQATVRQEPRYIDPDKCVGCGICTEKCPKKVEDEFNQGLSMRKAVYLRYPQAVPLVYSIDEENCIYFEKGRCRACEKFCQNEAIDFDQKEKVLTLDVGAVILAPGFDLIHGSIRPALGYDRYANVVSSLEFERLLSASGPTAGNIQRPSDGAEPKKVAWIQCVGSREPSLGRDYCSYVCCMYATKQALLAKEHQEDLEATIFYMDIRAQGKGFDRYYERSKDQGVRYVRSMVSRVLENLENQNLEIQYLDDLDQERSESFDMVILSLGMKPSAASRELAEAVGVETDRFGFSAFKDLNPLRTSRDGVFVCGSFQAPRDIPDTVMQASGAAAEAAAILSGARGTEVLVPEMPEERDVSGVPPRIGVFVCHCGTNIAGVVDVPAVVEYTKDLPYVEYTENLLFACATDSHDKIADLIKEYNLNRIVVASCSPRTHEALFQQTLSQAGLNPYLFELANIRDQCSWVHAQDHEAATAKAKDLIRMSVARAALLQPLHKLPVDVRQSALVIGGGVAGMTSAASLAEQGFRTHLVEKSDELGGVAKRLTRTIEGFDVPSYLADLKDKVLKNKLIEVHLESEVRSTSGHIGQFVSQLKNRDQTETIQHGAVIVASGAREYQPVEHLAGQDDRVLTQLSLNEALYNDENALEGVKDVVMIQCVGSRNEEHPYCSRICCTAAVANALRIKEINPEVEVTILFRDMRTFSLKELYYREARDKRVRFIRFNPDQPPEVTAGSDGLEISVFDQILRAPIILRADRLALSAAIRPQEDAPALTETLKIPPDSDGFFMEAHLKLRPVDFTNNGFFMAGLAHGPKFLEESIAQAKAAAARTATVLASASIEVGGMVAVVDPGKCAACLTCVRTCPYGVPRIGPHDHAEIEPALCHGCGACVSECPGKAISLQHFTDEQILAKAQAISA
ncbi:MAG: CoB--CoM heterodisulfide reductase iron-sulfur subunit A family protein [Deltaproteobacteria bacterium]|nr:CoB--CoM heterodisulfide reductase iron-sulfur subunit A family protein [Deltaproteobacteria bacterium]MBW2323794.1 CoB--CoM heterodisulfide reductase iron-sulfur subunit A family protein [Deltaproteobacteria bacterium]